MVHEWRELAEKSEIIPGEATQQVERPANVGSSLVVLIMRCNIRAAPTQTSCSGVAARRRDDGNDNAQPY